MKICLLLKARDEEKNIEKIVMSYQWVDKILIADGGSLDNTVAIAKSLPKVEVREFNERYYFDDGTWINQGGNHLNFLFDWAREEKANWIIHDDCDCFPNYLIKQENRAILEKSPYPFIFVTRLYVWRRDNYFPLMSKGGRGEWTAGLWAWKTNQKLRAIDRPLHFEPTKKLPTDKNRLDLVPPYCILHYFAPDDEIINKKIETYAKLFPGTKHPLEYMGHLNPLPEWAKL